MADEDMTHPETEPEPGTEVQPEAGDEGATTSVGRVVTLTLAALVVVAGGFVAYLALTQPDPVAGEEPVIQDDGTYLVGTLPDDQTDAVTTASETLALALSYDYRDLAASRDAATAAMTDDFAEEFLETFGETAQPLAKDKQAVTDAVVRAAGVVRTDGDRVFCLVYADQLLVNSETLKNEQAPINVSQSRVLVEVVPEGDGWAVDGITPIR